MFNRPRQNRRADCEPLNTSNKNKTPRRKTFGELISRCFHLPVALERAEAHQHLLLLVPQAVAQ
jgi:hypothetical protein